MPANLINKAVIKDLAAKASGLDSDQGNARLKEVLNRLFYDVMVAIDDLDVSMNEFWAAVGYIGEAAKANELGLVVPGTALEHFLDLRLDEAERRAGLAGGTTRTIEGPLYVAGAPRVKSEALCLACSKSRAASSDSLPESSKLNAAGPSCMK